MAPSRQESPLSAGPVDARYRALALDDRELVARVRAGDHGAFEQIFVAHYRTLYVFAYRYLGDRANAEDVLQNVFRNIWIRHAEWEPLGPVTSYLVAAIRNECLNTLRRAGVTRAFVAQTTVAGAGRPELSASPAGVEQQIEAAELAVTIESAAATLPPRCREVFLRRWRDGLSVNETAGRMGISPKTVEMQMTKALITVRERVIRYLER